jgi:hypothetical protein
MKRPCTNGKYQHAARWEQQDILDAVAHWLLIALKAIKHRNHARGHGFVPIKAIGAKSLLAAMRAQDACSPREVAAHCIIAAAVEAAHKPSTLAFSHSLTLCRRHPFSLSSKD